MKSPDAHLNPSLSRSQKLLTQVGQMYSIFQLGKATINENWEAVSFNLGIAGWHILNSRVALKLKLLKASNSFPIRQFARFTPLASRLVPAIPIAINLQYVIETHDWVEVLTDSAFIGLDTALGIAEVIGMELGPEAELPALILMIGDDVYHAVQKVKALDRFIHLYGNEKFYEGIRAFVGLDTSEYLKELSDRKQVNEQVTQFYIELLSQHPQINTLIYSLGSLYTVAGEQYTGEMKFNYASLLAQPKGRDDRLVALCQTQATHMIHFNQRTDNYINYNHDLPIVPSKTTRTLSFDALIQNHTQLLCLPHETENKLDSCESCTFLGYPAGLTLSQFNSANCVGLKDKMIGTECITTLCPMPLSLQSHQLNHIQERNTCGNSVIIQRMNAERTNGTILVHLDAGNKIYKTNKNQAHYFIIESGEVTLQGSPNQNDSFVLNNEVTGSIDARNGTNTLYLNHFSPLSTIINIDPNRGLISYQVNNQTMYLRFTGISRIVGRPNKKERIYLPIPYASNPLEYIDGQGGGDTMMYQAGLFVSQQGNGHLVQLGIDDSIRSMNTVDTMNTTMTHVVLYPEDECSFDHHPLNMVLQSSPGNISIHAHQSNAQNARSTVLLAHFFKEIQAIRYLPLQKQLLISCTRHTTTQHIHITAFNLQTLLLLTQEKYMLSLMVREIVANQNIHNHTVTQVMVHVPAHALDQDTDISKLKNRTQYHDARNFPDTIITAQLPYNNESVIIGSSHHDVLKSLNDKVFFEGGQGSDSYVVKPGDTIRINNYAQDNKTDYVVFRGDCDLSTYFSQDDLMMNASCVSTDSATYVQVMNYTQGIFYQHLQVLNQGILYNLLQNGTHPPRFKVDILANVLEIHNNKGIIHVFAKDILQYGVSAIALKIFDPLAYYRIGNSLVLKSPTIFCILVDFYNHILTQMINTETNFQLGLVLSEHKIINNTQLIAYARTAHNQSIFLENLFQQHIQLYAITNDMRASDIDIYHIQNGDRAEKIGLLDISARIDACETISAHLTAHDLVFQFTQPGEVEGQLLTLRNFTLFEIMMPILLKISNHTVFDLYQINNESNVDELNRLFNDLNITDCQDALLSMSLATESASHRVKRNSLRVSEPVRSSRATQIRNPFHLLVHLMMTMIFHLLESFNIFYQENINNPDTCLSKRSTLFISDRILAIDNGSIYGITNRLLGYTGN